jgi:hypothetical protein
MLFYALWQNFPIPAGLFFIFFVIIFFFYREIKNKVLEIIAKRLLILSGRRKLVMV